MRFIFKNIPPIINGFLRRNDFFKRFLNEGSLDELGTTIPFVRFRPDEDEIVKEYIENHLLNKKAMPSVSPGLKKEMIKSISEIYVNAYTHGRCKEVYCCGQHFPTQKTPEIYFTMVDLGVTIKNNVTEFLKRPLTGIESIDWAMSDNNSTKIENHSGGLGLKLIKEFITFNLGTMQIISSNGVWDLSKGQTKKSDLIYDFPGTIVTLVFNLKDQNKYRLSSESTSFNAF